MSQCVRNFIQKTSFERRMSLLSLLVFCFMLFSGTAAGLYSADPSLVVSTEGQSICLPCGVPSESCSSINWTMEEMIPGWFSDVVMDGRVTSADARYHLLKDCSLEIAQVKPDDAHMYTCQSGSLNSSVSLQILEVIESQTPAEGTIELHCYLNTFKGYVPCSRNSDIHIRWTDQNDEPLNGQRFRSETLSACFSKLFITKKLTDHHRTWKCHVLQNNQIKASVSYETTVEGGLEEVFAAVGESVSLTCTSSLSSGGNTEWTVNKTPLRNMSSETSPTKAFHLDEDSSLVISKLSPLNAGEYQCTESTGLQRVLNKIRLHTLDVTAESGSAGVKLTCVLTCAEQCEENFNLSWSGTSREGWQSRSTTVNKTLISMMLLTVWPESSDELICSVKREGSTMALKEWQADFSLQKLAWLGLISLLICAAAGGCYMYRKWKQNKDAANEHPGIGMTQVYDVIQDVEVKEQRPFKREVPTTDDGFYDLLQAVS
ncbi:uncharacterized protein [Nothobranchius furzeri]|uniref:uncharacterized protein n=1 Tax=Nothobranchius furzeri TaxID=105023 RepID=UPI003904D18E